MTHMSEIHEEFRVSCVVDFERNFELFDEVVQQREDGHLRVVFEKEHEEKERRRLKSLWNFWFISHREQ